MKNISPLVLLLLACSVTSVSSGGQSQGPEDAPQLAQACAALDARALFADEPITIKTRVETRASDGQARCVIHGSIVSSPTSTISFRVDLPQPARWNGKLLFVGGGGFDGFVITDSGTFPDAMWGGHRATMSSYAWVSTDSGHQGRGVLPYADFGWALGNPTGIKNHAYQANHIVLWKAVSLAKAVYGREPAQRYIIGASNGGRAGLVAAQRYPADYHGVVSLEPAISQEGFAANLTPMFRHIYSSPENWLGPAQIELYRQAELAACDALDGLEDGILGNPDACRYDPVDLQCAQGEKPSDRCLTSGQIATVRLIHGDKKVPVELADGITGYPGYGRGAVDWAFFFGTSYAARDALDFVLADNIVRYGITRDPNASVMTHQPEKWRGEYLALSNEIDATNPDLTAFSKQGGKLIVWYGVADGCVTYKRTAEYLASVNSKLGEAATRQFIRFYISPSVGHTMSGPGADSIDLLSALDGWVASGRAPTGLIASKPATDGRAGFSRPLCEFPKLPKYLGKGDVASAKSFTCATQ